MNSIEIVNDIRTVCLSGNKMTEKERVEIVFGIRPKLKKMNKQMKRLTRAVKYTTMGDVWMEIDEGARPTKANKAEIAAAAKRRWKQVGQERKLMEQREQSRTCSSYARVVTEEDEVKP